MSADNGVYIHKFRDGWRVVEGSAIENIYWRSGKRKYNHHVLKEYFSESPVFKTEIEALKYALTIYKELDVCEYGIKEV